MIRISVPFHGSVPTNRTLSSTGPLSVQLIRIRAHAHVHVYVRVRFFEGGLQWKVNKSYTCDVRCE